MARFEQDMASYLNVPGAAAVQSGTAAIHLAMLLSGVKPGQEVIVPTLTLYCLSQSSCIHRCCSSFYGL
ncbi:DegT/DnrJ/EryC1/StrS aminotransferase [Pelosinus fermentans A11]|nr:DegT/DnrJ/EryC1/StrS aminotransferase [Pelosinus fermentans A11]